MALYPGCDSTQLDPDPRSLYLASGRPLPLPTFTPLEAGEMLVFDPEILHGTHLNVTDQTRIAVSLRLNAGRPRFDPDAFYAREFWRRAADVEAGRFEAIEHVRREDNLGEARVRVVAPPIAPRVVRVAGEPGDLAPVAPSDSLADGERLIVELTDRRILLLRRAGRLHAFDASCPHYGLDLVDGGDDGAKLHCPACAVPFDMETGLSAAPSLRLTVYEAHDVTGHICLRIPTDPALTG